MRYVLITLLALMLTSCATHSQKVTIDWITVTQVTKCSVMHAQDQCDTLLASTANNAAEHMCSQVDMSVSGLLFENVRVPSKDDGFFHHYFQSIRFVCQ